ncbi:MAG: hypothetical protein KAT93_01180, partial [Desulfuromonadales bacterium]|nr:hypothetical protein [Desulfuromonadales bacterium]
SCHPAGTIPTTCHTLKQFVTVKPERFLSTGPISRVLWILYRPAGDGQQPPWRLSGFSIDED